MSDFDFKFKYIAAALWIFKKKKEGTSKKGFFLSVKHNSISIQNVTKSFWGLNAVNRCSFNIMGGTITGIIGPNGAGKSTLFNIISGQMDCDIGDILIGDKYITNMQPHQIAQRGLFRTFQVAHEYPRMNLITTSDRSY